MLPSAGLPVNESSAFLFLSSLLQRHEQTTQSHMSNVYTVTELTWTDTNTRIICLTKHYSIHSELGHMVALGWMHTPLWQTSVQHVAQITQTHKLRLHALDNVTESGLSAGLWCTKKAWMQIIFMQISFFAANVLRKC